MKKSVFFIAILFSYLSYAQCAMCRAVIETGGNKQVAEGINSGITYLMAFPYILVGAIIFLIYRQVSKKRQETES